MPLLSGESSENKSAGDKIDYDFYDSALSADSFCDEETNLGVKQILIKPLEEANVTKTEVETNPGNKDPSNGETESDCEIADDLTKCIAYETNANEHEMFDKSEDAGGFSDYENPVIGSSLSASTPSDFTTVTSLTSSSSLSSLNKDKSEDGSCSAVEDLPRDVKLLADAVKTLSLKNEIKRRSAIPVCTNSQFTSKPRRKNMTFTNEELRKIDRENEILQKKIISCSKTNSKNSIFAKNSLPPRTVQASSAVNRSKKQQEITHDNYILWKKIRNAKASQSYFNTRSTL